MGKGERGKGKELIKSICHSPLFAYANSGNGERGKVKGERADHRWSTAGSSARLSEMQRPRVKSDDISSSLKGKPNSMQMKEEGRKNKIPSELL